MRVRDLLNVPGLGLRLLTDVAGMDRAIRHVFKLTNALPRIERLYLYNWRFDGNRSWDSGLIAGNGRPRVGYYQLLDGLSLARFKPVPVPIDDPVSPALPGATPPGSGG